MSGLLLDTHTYPWLLKGDPRLPNAVRHLIREPDRPCYLSIASYWEIAIKIGLGKLIGYSSLDDALDPEVIGPVVGLLPVTRSHAQTYSLLQLPPDHRDPFDRMLVAQCICDRLELVSADTKLDGYPIPRVWPIS